MSVQQKGSLQLSMTIGNTPLPGTRLVDIGYLHIGSSTRLAIPTIHLKIGDSSDFLIGNQLLYDGSPISVTIGVPDAGVATYNFILNSYTPDTTGSRVVELDGYLDLPLYWNNTSITPIQGSSSSALGKIASACGMQFSGDSSSDSQVWYPRNRFFYDFAQDIAEHGYTDDYSCMVLGCDLTGKLIYRNLALQSSSLQTTSISVGVMKKGFLWSPSASFKFKSGSMNHLSGYASSIINQSALSTSYSTLTDTVKIKGDIKNRRVQINKSLKDSLYKTGRTFISPIDCGNTHPNYSVAAYQNKRLMSTYVIKGEIILNSPSSLSLLDPVNISIDSAQRPDLAKYSGAYTVSSKVIFSDGVSYYEKIEVMSRSASLNPNNSM
jgi:hypothetical protein